MSNLECQCSELKLPADVKCFVCYDNQRIRYSNLILKIAQAAGFKIATAIDEIVERVETQRRYALQSKCPPIGRDERLAAVYVLNKYLNDADCTESLAEECGEAFVDDAKSARDKLIATLLG
jgi:hypothetical protein